MVAPIPSCSAGLSAAFCFLLLLELAVISVAPLWRSGLCYLGAARNRHRVEGRHPMAKTVLDLAAAQELKTMFYEAVGEFVLEFANVEKSAVEILIHMAGVSPVVGAAIFSGAHIDTAKG